MKNYVAISIIFILAFLSKPLFCDSFKSQIGIGKIRKDLKNQIAMYLDENISYYKFEDINLTYTNEIDNLKKNQISKIVDNLDSYFIATVKDTLLTCNYDFKINDYPKLNEMKDYLDDFKFNFSSDLKSAKNINNFVQIIEQYMISLSNRKLLLDSYNTLFTKAKYKKISKKLDKQLNYMKSKINDLNSISFFQDYNYQLQSFEKTELLQKSIKLNKPQLQFLSTQVLELGNNYVYDFQKISFADDQNGYLKLNSVNDLVNDNDYFVPLSYLIDYKGNYINYKKNIIENASVKFTYLYDSSKPIKEIHFKREDSDEKLIVVYSKMQLKQINGLPELIQKTNETYGTNLQIGNEMYNTIDYLILKGNKMQNEFRACYDSNHNLKLFDSQESISYSTKTDYFYMRKNSKIALNFELKHSAYSICNPFNLNKLEGEYIYTYESKPYDSLIEINSIESQKSVFNNLYTIIDFQYKFPKPPAQFTSNPVISHIELIKKYNLPYAYYLSNAKFIVEKYIQ